MMNPGDIGFLAGLLLGLASALHCAGMCGGIAASLMFTLRPAGGAGLAADLRVLILAQAARVTAYVAAGSVLGYAGSGLYGAFDQTAVHALLRWVAAAALGWIGLGLMGLAPPLTALDRVTGPIAGRLAGLQRGAGAFAPLAAGLVWGLLPCGMVYGALFYAMLSGSAGGGATVMAGFGLGTIPAVTAAALGIGGLRRAARSARARIAVGAVLVVLAVIGAIMPARLWAMICGY